MSDISDIKGYMREVGERARSASASTASASTAQKNSVLLAIAERLDQSRNALLAANDHDMQRGRDHGLDAALLDRLALNDTRIDAMLDGLNQVAALPDPVGSIEKLQSRPSGIQVGKMRVPLGVIGIIYESRPNVTVEAASLCLKSGNATILRGGSEASQSNQAIARCIRQGLADRGVVQDAVQVVETTDRAAVGELIAMPDYVDVIVPRGGKGLIERISRGAKVTVIKHLDGNCHVYLDSDLYSQSDRQMAIDIVINAKTQRYGTCNTAESLLIHGDRAEALLPDIARELARHKVELRVCEKTAAILDALESGSPTPSLGIDYSAASEQDWYQEYLAPVLSIKIVASLDAAIAHINQFSSQHTETIVTGSHVNAMRFLREVDSSSVMVNASTRFADGFEYGLGAEIGISTDKIHARGPVGLEGLTSEKYIVLGSGQIRQ